MSFDEFRAISGKGLNTIVLGHDVHLDLVGKTKVVRVDWLGNLANHKEDYNVSLFHVVCTVTVMIFCSRCDASSVCCLLARLHLKAFCYLCTVNVIFQ